MSSASLKESGSGAMRILVVEDEFLMGLQLQEDLEDAGCRVVGPYTDLSSGLLAARNERFDIAVLDVNLNGEVVFPIADALAARGIPFVLLTGYSASNLPGRYQDMPICAKPCETRLLLRKVEALLAAQEC